MVVDVPSRWIRRCAMQLCLLIALTAGLAGPTTADPANVNDAGPQVRSTDAVIRGLIAEATSLSRTFRHLVETINGTDGIVYVEPGRCGHGVRACLTLSVTAAGPYRMLRILIDLRQKPWDLMASIGHELRHAIEVLENRRVMDTATMFLLYSQGSMADGKPFETDDAIQAGYAVRNEIESSFNAAR